MSKSGDRLKSPTTSGTEARLHFVQFGRPYRAFVNFYPGLSPEPRPITLEPRGPKPVEKFTRVTFFKNVASGNVRT